ncbi:MAG: hypothetical protein WD270_00860 [Acetobacterales bacterium]
MRKTALLLVAALAFPGTAMAQTTGGGAGGIGGTDRMRSASQDRGPRLDDMEFTLSGNGTSNNDFDGHQLGLSASVGQYIYPNVLAGVRQSVNFTDVENGDDLLNASTRIFLDYVFDMGAFRPYVGLIFGGIYGDNVNDTFAAGPEVGLKYYADTRTFLFAQTEYQFTFDDAGDAGDAADDGQFYHTIGVGFNF